MPQKQLHKHRQVMVTAGAAVPGGCLVWDGGRSNDFLVLMDAHSKLPRPIFPKAFWICVFVFGKAQKSSLGSTFAAFLVALLALGVHSNTRVRRCGGDRPMAPNPCTMDGVETSDLRV